MAAHASDTPLALPLRGVEAHVAGEPGTNSFANPGKRESCVRWVQLGPDFAVPTTGGPIEPKGRLRYIDGCSDSLLCAPPRKGDPCLNHLHFPGGIDQTEHTHPSLRAGIIARGEGACCTPDGETRLTRNLIFVIPAAALHRFRTDQGQSMDVVPYHPDSDYGPTDEEHPMVNRTLVGGRKIDNTQGRHAIAELMTAVMPL